MSYYVLCYLPIPIIALLEISDVCGFVDVWETYFFLRFAVTPFYLLIVSYLYLNRFEDKAPGLTLGEARCVMCSVFFIYSVGRHIVWSLTQDQSMMFADTIVMVAFETMVPLCIVLIGSIFISYGRR